MCNWLKSLFGKKCHCEDGCCGDKKTADTAPVETKEETTTENVVPTEENKV